MNKEAVIVAGVVVGTTCCFLTFAGDKIQTAPVDSPPEPKPGEAIPSQTEVPALPETETTAILASPIPPSECPEGWIGEKIDEGEWPLQVIRDLTDPDNLEGPFKLIHRDGSVQTFETWDEFPTVYPGEEICVKNGGRGNNHGGTIYEARNTQKIINNYVLGQIIYIAEIKNSLRIPI